MSEVKRDICHACVSLPRETHCPVCDPEIGCRKELDAQRLRADTAEAERDKVVAFAVEHFSKLTSADGSGHADCALAVLRMLGRNSHEADRIVNAYKKDRTWRRNDMAEKLAAAEQRIAELTEVMKSLPFGLHPSTAFIEGDCQCSQCEFVRCVRAALTPNPEAESHE